MHLAVSVIVPTHNRKAFVTRAVASVLDQTYPVHEVLIIDDASTDETESAIQNLDDKRVRYLRLSRNFGGAVARNTGIDASRGEYIAFLDSDDQWLPQKLETQMRDVKPGSTDGVLFCCNAFLVKGEQMSLYNKRAPAKNELIAEYFLCTGQSFVTSGILVAAVLAKRTRFDERLSKHQDWDFVLRILQAGGSYHYLDEPLVKYNDHVLDRRISKTPAFDATLLWFGNTDYLTLRAKKFLYFSQYFFLHLKSNPIKATIFSFHLLSQDISSSFEVFRKALLRLGG